MIWVFTLIVSCIHFLNEKGILIFTIKSCVFLRISRSHNIVMNKCIIYSNHKMYVVFSFVIGTNNILSDFVILCEVDIYLKVLYELAWLI